MVTTNLDERLRNLTVGFNGIGQQLAAGQVAIVDPLIASHILPMFGDLVGCVSLLHELTNDMSDEMEEPARVLVGIVEQIITAEVLPEQWQGALLFALQPMLEALGEVEGVKDFQARYQPQIAKLEAWNKQQQAAQAQASPTTPPS